MSKHVSNSSKFGLTDNEAERIFEAQHRRCAVCGKPFRPGRPANVDHHHATGLVRGLLCHHCNYTLGQLHEDVAWLSNAAEYLRRPPAVKEIGKVFTPNSPGAAGLPVLEQP